MEPLKEGYKDNNLIDIFIHEWKSPLNSGKVLILVEGKNDRVFYYKFFNPQKTEIRELGGCGSLKKIHEGLNEYSKIKNIAIKDADFERLNGVPVELIGFFYTDSHDYEMMCLKDKFTQKELMENLSLEYSESVFNDIFKELKYISYFKWYNFAFHLNYNFKGFSVTALSKEQLRNFEFIYENICSKSPKKESDISETSLNDFITKHTDCDIYELTCGHDFIKRFCEYLRREHGIQKGEDRLKDSLHPCFRMDAFMKTALYRSIQRWSCEHELEILKN